MAPVIILHHEGYDEQKKMITDHVCLRVLLKSFGKYNVLNIELQYQKIILIVIVVI